MPKQRFVYVTYIATTPGQLWNALLDSEMTRQYWEPDNVSDWKPGSRWEHRRLDAARSIDVVGKVVASEPHRRLAITWASPVSDSDDDERGHSKVTFELEPVAGAVRLRVMHEGIAPASFSDSGGWPAVLSSLKTLLETGQPLRNLW